MSGYSELKSSINRVIKTNDNREITGQILQNTLNSMVNSLGANYHFSGFASPITNPGTPDQNIFYITTEEGTYVNFDRIELGPGLSFLLWRDNQWSHETLSTGDATKKWVQENYVSIEFFRSLFRAYDENGNEILPNNNPEGAMPSVVDNIKAMVGFWTEQYISALGQQTGGGGGSGATSLDELSDVFLTNPSLGQALVFTITPDHPEGIWVNQTIQAGTDMATVWAALAGNTTQQINISHLTDALADYATKTYVEQNFITVAYFDKLFRAYNGNTLVSHNDVTSTIDNIKAMFGFWTEQYLSALGNNSGGGGQLLALSNMADVTLTAPIADKQVLTFDAVTQKWVNSNAQAGASSLATLTDVNFSTLSGGQVVLYDSMQSKWVNSNLKTINGQSLYGNGDIPISSGGTGNYLPLSGGILTGALGLGGSQGIGANNTGFFRVGRFDEVSGSIKMQFGSDNASISLIDRAWTKSIFSIESSGYLRTIGGVECTNLELYFSTPFIDFHYNRSQSDFTSRIWEESSGLLSFECYTAFKHNISIRGDAYISGSVDVGSITGFETNPNYSAAYRWGLYQWNNNLTINARNTSNAWIADIMTISLGNRAVGIGTSPSYTLHVAGTIYATGAITALSDARKKDITGEAGVTVEQIAHAPAVQFLWKDKERRKDGQQVGTLAQYWQTVLPEVVSDKGGELSMQYGVAALVSSIIIARKVANHEVRIDKMEKWMKKWAEENDE